MDRDHLNESQWAAYRARSLSASAMLAVSDHLAACAHCAARRPEFVPVSPGALDLPERAPYEDVAAWVDGTLTDPVDREIFEAHLQLDPRLGAEVADLAAFKSTLGRLPPREHRPAEVPANVVAFRRWAVPLAAAALAMLALILWRPWQPPARARLSVASLTVPPLPPELQTRRGTLAGAGSEPARFAALRPARRIVRERRPLLRWTAAPGAESYTVTLARLGDGALVEKTGLPSAARSWQPPEPLVPGAIYEWQVSAVREGAVFDQAPKPPEPEARFQVLDAAGETTLAAAENARDRSAISLGIAFARVGLVEEADAQFHVAGADGEPLRGALREAGRRAGYLR